MLLNLNVMMASYAEEKGHLGYSSAWDAAFNDKSFDPKYQHSLSLTFILGIVNLCGYIIITGFLALTEIPVIIRQTVKKMEDHDPDDPTRDPSAWDAYGRCIA